jgi:hypothetical protein
MALSDRMTERPPAAPWKVCSICWIREQVSPEDRETLDVMLADRQWRGHEIEQILRDEYRVVIGIDSVGKHRRGHMGTS